MKRAKIMLTAIGILTFGSAAIALNLNKHSFIVYTCNATGDIPPANATTLVDVVGAGPSTTIGTLVWDGSATCTIVSVLFED